MLRMEELTYPEQLFIHRRRMKITQAKAAKLFNVPIGRYRAWETGEDVPTRDTVRRLKVESGGPLSINEVATLLRRRSGLKQPEVARELGVTTHWLCRMELGVAPVNQALMDRWHLG